MDYAYHFGAPDRLYLNVTNRCTCACTFCVRGARRGLGDGHLTGEHEPDLEELLAAVEHRSDPAALEEIVWCGFGEPTFRLDLILAASPVFREAGIRVRLNTNGHGSLINGHDLLPALAEVLDAISISLNAPDCDRYLELCRPDPAMLDAAGPVPPERFWSAMLEQLEQAAATPGLAVQASVVGHSLSTAEVAGCRRLTDALGCPLRVR